jgi:polysaccharide biosynthesis protein PslG
MRFGILRALVRALLLVAFAASLLSPSFATTAQAQVDDYRFPRYFPETGFWVQGAFREYWETNGGLYIFGYPITGVFFEDGMNKQYFQRAIFEYHPENAGTRYEVLLQRLGSIRTEGRHEEEAFQPLLAQTDANCTFYPQTGHRLCHGFRTFWESHGGLPNFGYPISEEFDERNDPPPAGDGNVHTVQYYERARFEWHPEHRGTRYEVLLGLLGSEYLMRNPAPAEATARQSPDSPPLDPISGVRHGPHAGFGFNIAWRGDENAAGFHQQTFDKVNEAGFSWIRIQVTWTDLEPQRGRYQFGHVDRIVDHARANNLRIIASVVKAPRWATGDGTDGIPADARPYEMLMERLAQRYVGRIDAYGRYVNLLKAGYTGTKRGDPQAIVLFGGLTPTGVIDPHLAIDDVVYLQRIYAYNNGEIKKYYDALGAHPGSNNNSPDQWWPGRPGPDGWTNHNSFYFRRVEELRRIMVQHGEGHKQIWLTEFGWTTQNPAQGYEYGAQISEEMQAEYLTRAFQIARNEWPWMGVMAVWNLNFAVVVDPLDEKGPWGVLRSDWSNRPAFEALKRIEK